MWPGHKEGPGASEESQTPVLLPQQVSLNLEALTLL